MATNIVHATNNLLVYSDEYQSLDSFIDVWLNNAKAGDTCSDIMKFYTLGPFKNSQELIHHVKSASTTNDKTYLSKDTNLNPDNYLGNIKMNKINPDFQHKLNAWTNREIPNKINRNFAINTSIDITVNLTEEDKEYLPDFLFERETNLAGKYEVNPNIKFTETQLTYLINKTNSKTRFASDGDNEPVIYKHLYKDPTKNYAFEINLQESPTYKITGNSNHKLEFIASGYEVIDREMPLNLQERNTKLLTPIGDLDVRLFTTYSNYENKAWHNYNPPDKTATQRLEFNPPNKTTQNATNKQNAMKRKYL